MRRRCALWSKWGPETMPVDVTNDMDLDQGINGLVLHIQGFGFRDTPLSYQIVYVPPNARKLEVKPEAAVEE